MSRRCRSTIARLNAPRWILTVISEPEFSPLLWRGHIASAKSKDKPIFRSGWIRLAVWLGRFADSPRGLPNRCMMEWRSVALGHFDRLLAEDHTQQADQCDERRGRRPDMDKPVSRPNGETHDEGDEIADHDGLPIPAAAAQCGQPHPPRPCDRPPAHRRARRSLRWARRDNLRRRIPERAHPGPVPTPQDRA
jgi:hypothetical protein